MKHAVIVHGCPSSPDDPTYNHHWMPWVKTQLEQQGYNVEFPTMPEPWAPSYNNFKTAFKDITITPETILIGHSCGTAFLTHYLSEYNKVTAKQLILVAPWKINHCNDYFREGFYDFDINPTIKERISNITFFTADNEEPEGKISLEIYHKVLGGEIITIPTYGHYTLSDMQTEEFSELLQNIINYN